MANAIRKRIALALATALGASALVAVAAAPAQANATSMKSDFGSVTVVSGSISDTSTAAIFKLSMSGAAGAVNIGSASLTVSVSGLPTGETDTAALAIGFDETITVANTVNYKTDTGTNANGLSDGAVASSNTLDGVTPGATETGTYYLYVVPGSVTAGASNNPIDAGEYTLTADLTSGNVILTRLTLKVNFVSGVTSQKFEAPKLSVATDAFGQVGVRLGGVEDQLITVTVRDKNDGALRKNSHDALDPVVALVKSSTIVLETVTVADDGSGAGDETADDGVFSVEFAAANITSSYLGANTVRARLGLTTATAAQTINPAVTALTAQSKIAATGTGLIASGANYIAPLTTSEFTVNITALVDSVTVAPAQVLGVTVTTTGVKADVSPTDAEVQYLTSDANGGIAVKVTNVTPAHSEAITVTVTGLSGGSGSIETTITYQRPTPTTVVMEPGGNYVAALKTEQKFTVTVLDQFGATMPGASILLTHAGKNAPTTALSSRVLDANGQTTYSFTDSKAAAADSDTIGVSRVGDTAISASVKVTYAATAPAATALTAYFAQDTAGAGALSPTALNVVTLAPATAIAAANPVNIDTDADITESLTGNDAVYHLRFDANVEGVPVTLTAGKGGHVLNAAGKPAASRTLYTNADGDVFFAVFGTGTGEITYTATSGAVSKAVVIEYENAETDAKVISLAVSGNVATATVKDNFGNPVEGVAVAFSRTGTVTINGGTGATLDTNASGVADVVLVGSGTVAATVTEAGTQVKWIAGFNGTTALATANAAAIAGVASASVTVSDIKSATETAASAAQAAAAANSAAIAKVQEQVTALASSVTTLIAALSAQVKRLQTALTNLRKLVRAL